MGFFLPTIMLLLLHQVVFAQNSTYSLTVNSSGRISANITANTTINLLANGSPSPTKTTGGSEMLQGPVISASKQTNCFLVPNDTTVPSTIKSMLNDGAKLIKYHLHIEHEEEVFANISYSTMYRPLFWMRTTGRQGRGILLLRPEYDMLSLSTLEFGVYSLNVTLNEHPRQCLTTLNYLDIERIFRELVMNDFQNTTSGNMRPTDNVCNMHVLNNSGVADFRYFCCNISDNSQIQCHVLETELWLNVLFGVVTLIKVLVLLFSPTLIPESIYRLKHITVPFVYITEPEEPVRLKVVLTKDPDRYKNTKMVCKVSKFRHMAKFRTTIQNMIPEVMYDFSFDKVELMLNQKRLLCGGSAPVGLFESLYESIFKCKIRDNSSVQPCCDASVCSKGCCGPHYSWYRLLKEIMKALLLVLIALPWMSRVWIYYMYEHGEMDMRKMAANKRGLRFYFPGSFTLYLTPIHLLFVVVYTVLGIEAFFFGILKKKTTEKMKFILRKCFNDMHEFDKQRVLGWVVQVMLLPCVSFGIFGFLVAPVIWVVMLPIALIISAFYVFPTINLTGRLVAHFMVYLVPRALCTRCKFSSITSKMIKKLEDVLQTELDIKNLTEMESMEKNKIALRTKCGRFQQLIVIIFCLISLYSCIFLLTEFVTFLVEMVVYTMIGIILNASITLTYISLGLYIVFYANDVVGNVSKKFITFSSTLNSYILDLGKSQAEPVFFKNYDEQLNRAFRVKTGRPCVPKLPVELVKNDENEPRWSFSKLVLFITNRDQPQIPKRFYFSACNMPYSLVPGQLLSNYVTAFKELGLIALFLLFVLVVVLAFGESYKLSATDQLLAAMASGFIPLMLRRVLFKTQSVPAIDTLSDINFQVCIFDLLNSYKQSWPIFDIDVGFNSKLISVDKCCVNEGFDTQDTEEANSREQECDGTDVRVEIETSENTDQTLSACKSMIETTQGDEVLDLVIDTRDVDTDDFPKMSSEQLVKGDSIRMVEV